MPDQHSQSGERLEREQALAALMRAANEGDKNAYRLFLEKVMPFVRGLTRRHRAASGSSDGEDIVQEVLLALHLKRHTWQPDQAISPWIAAITRHKIIDEFRKTKRRMELPFDENFDAPNPEPEQDMLSNREMERLMSQVSDSHIHHDGRPLYHADRLAFWHERRGGARGFAPRLKSSGGGL
jgi:RNA polymerase sigma-70 factor, ECF subfamily